ncbi:MAG: hypothetical protein K2X01_06570 [Cyanobacteria bacterium]|nr:hypothetical protein [Cyanobacteriota bacterium]
MSSPAVIWQLSKDYFKRNNPIETLAKTMFETAYNLITFNSKMKLLKYKFMLAQQQLNNMEQFVGQNPYQVSKGSRFDRAY